MENNKKDLERFSLIMWGVAEEFGGKISKEGMKMKFEAMKDFSIKEIQKAGTWILKNREENFPPVPTVREFIVAIETNFDTDIPIKSKAMIQAGQIIKAINEYNPDMEVRFKDPITSYIMKNKWSLRELSTRKEIDNTWIKKEFIEAYEAYTEMIDKGQDVDLIENKELLRLANNSTKKIER